MSTLKEDVSTQPHTQHQTLKCSYDNTFICLTHCGLVTPYGDIELGQHWLRSWLVAWPNQSITWTNVDSSSEISRKIHLRAISQELPYPSITKISLKIIYLKFNWNLPGANELKSIPRTWILMTIKLTNIKLEDTEYRQVSNIRRTKSQHLKNSRDVLQLSLPHPLKPDVKSRMKM